MPLNRIITVLTSIAVSAEGQSMAPSVSNSWGWPLMEMFWNAALPDLVALLLAAGVFYFLSTAMQVSKREKPWPELESDIDRTEIPNISGCTQLHWAAHNGQLRDVEILLSRGADVNAMDNYHETPLHMAARSGYLDICDALLDAGADPRFLNKNHKTALLIAALSGHKEICDLLSPLKLSQRLVAERAEVSEPMEEQLSETTASSEEEPSFGCNELHWAALRRSLMETCAALARGVPVDARDPWGDTALHLAARAGAEEICVTLCAARADPLLLNKEGKSTIEVARIAGHHQISQLLQEHC